MTELIAIMQLMGGLICVGGYPLQFWRLWRLKDSASFSLFWTASVAIGLLFMEPYALYLVIHEGTGHFWLVTHTASVIATSTLALMVWRYRNPPEPPVPTGGRKKSGRWYATAACDRPEGME